MKTKSLTPQQKIIRELSDRIVAAQKPIRILNSIKWSEHTQHEFLKQHGKKMPNVNKDYYKHISLTFDPEKKADEFFDIERDIHKHLGQFSGIGNIMSRICREYRTAVHMLQARGTEAFGKLSAELYGSAEDSFYANGPSLADLADVLSYILTSIKGSLDSELDEKKYSSRQGVNILKKQLNKYFTDPNNPIQVKIDDGIVADAAAGADIIKLRKSANFSKRDLRILEVHEGWVHVGTTMNGKLQPVCTFLSKGPPSATIFQEGLAVIVEIVSFASHPSRIRKITNRIKAILMAEQGANFIEVYNFFLDQGLDPQDSYHHTSRVFRGSTPTGKPFTKDLAYSKGFILIYNYLRLAIAEGKISRIPLLFLGKTSIEDLQIYEDLIKDGTIIHPRYIPPHFKDLAGLSCWLSYSLFLNKLDLNKMHENYKTIL